MNRWLRNPRSIRSPFLSGARSRQQSGKRRREGSKLREPELHSFIHCDFISATKNFLAFQFTARTHTHHLHHSTLKRGLIIIAHLPSPRDRFPWSRTSSSLHPWAGSWRRGCCSRRSKSRRRPACRGAWRWSRREGKGSTSRWRRTRGSPSRRRWTVSTLRGPWRSPLLLSMK